MAARKLLDDLNKDLNKVVHSEDNLIGKLLTKLELATNVKREYVVHGAISIFLSYLVLGKSAELICNVTGFLYPAYASMKALKSADKVDDTQWLTYWTVFAMFSVIEFASEEIVGWFPLYWLAKFFFLLWLYLPMTRGAEYIYENFLVPAADKFAKRLEEIQTELVGEIQKLPATHQTDSTEIQQVQSQVSHASLEKDRPHQVQHNGPVQVLPAADEKIDLPFAKAEEAKAFYQNHVKEHEKPVERAMLREVHTNENVKPASDTHENHALTPQKAEDKIIRLEENVSKANDPKILSLHYEAF